MNEAASTSQNQADLSLSTYQKGVIAILVFLQFTVVLDFMVLSPVGAILMPALNIDTSQFGLVVSSYAFAAALSGILAAGFTDKYDRKKILLFFYVGFVLSTLFCALSTNYTYLVTARILTGIFGGVISSVVLSISTDLFPIHKRGQVIGYVQTAFASSQVFGVPLGLTLANHFGWHTPFVLIVGIGAVVGVFIFWYLKPIDEHLKLQKDNNAFRHLALTIRNPTHIKGFAAVALLALGGYMIMPFSSAFIVNNVGISLERLPLVYLATGSAAMISGPLLGRWSDKIGKIKLNQWGTVLTITMVLIFTHLSNVPIYVLMVTNGLLFVGITARIIASQSINSAVPAPDSRGAYMAISSSMQQISGGIGAAISGLMVTIKPDGSIRGFDHVGYVVAISAVITTVMLTRMARNLPGFTDVRAKH
jgi:predicted MFS family arabinose efflux permease